MSREIKFRAWDGESLRVLDQMYVGVGQIGFSDSHYVDLGEHDHEDSAVEQYTGRTDKNGREVYEGDIVEGGFEKHRGVVTFGNYANPFGGDQRTGYQCFYIRWQEDADLTRGDMNYWFTNHMDTAAEVIGNIHENPELLSSGVGDAA